MRKPTMIPPAVPANERERLADLHALELLDTPPEERFERIVRLAMEVFEVPIAYLALIDADRQWLKARCGIARGQTGREESFCGHTILGTGPLIVPDTLDDPRFRDNPLVVGDPGIRFYAGHPLAGPAGFNVGTLCIADTRPRSLSDQQQAAFCQLAALAEHEVGLVDLVATQRQLLETKEALTTTQRRLSRELADAAAFVQSMLPPPLTEGPVTTAHRLVACSELGGDMIGVITPRSCPGCVAFYLLDVSGHGVGSSLLSVAIANAIRLQSLPGATFDDPASVLAALNRAFPAEDNHDKFFTIWYAAYDASSRLLTYAVGGHHPAVLLTPDQSPQLLGTAGPLVGMFDDVAYTNEQLTVADGSRLLLFSDGAFEVATADGGMLGFEGLVYLIGEVASEGDAADADDRLRAITGRIDAMRQGEPADDFTMLEVCFR
jgi:sigma-B regulation protein RsbU (phosphoserine phosphatase)